MAYSTFAAIDIGSSCMEMVIYEISRDSGIKKIDHIRHIFELGKSTYETREVDFEDVEKMCDILYGFSEIMKDYCIDDYRAFATSALREAKNAIRVLDRIKVRTGIDVEILSNSEQRFITVSYTHLRAHETDSYLVCRLLLEKKKQTNHK